MSQSYYPILIAVIKSLAAVLAGVLLGNGAVYFFNRMPAAWFTEPDGQPDPSLTDRGSQRIKSYPWKFVFSMLFIAAGIWFLIRDWKSGVAMLLILWLMTEIAIGDAKYRIIPDQLVILLGVCGVGLVSYQRNWDFVWGALAGFLILFIMALIGRLLYGEFAAGGGDIKMFTALGVSLGLLGTLTVFLLTTVFSAAGAGVRAWRTRKLTPGNKRAEKERRPGLPMAPYAAAAVLVYFAFLWGRLELIGLSF